MKLKKHKYKYYNKHTGMSICTLLKHVEKQMQQTT